LQACLIHFREEIGFAFVSDPSVVAELSAILPLAFLTFFLTGPLIVIGAHFQAIGDARTSLLLGLTKPYLFVIPLIFLLPLVTGEDGVWLAWAAGDLLLLGLVGVILFRQRLRPSTSGISPTISETN